MSPEVTTEDATTKDAPVRRRGRRKRGTKNPPMRWTDDQVRLLLETVKGSRTNSGAFEEVAKELGKNPGTVQQKYYNLLKSGVEAPTRDTAPEPVEPEIQTSLRMRLICKDRVKHQDGTLTYMATYTDVDNRVLVILLKRPNDDWRGEVFRGSTSGTFGKSELTPVGRFPLHRLSVPAVTELSALCIKSYEQRVRDGGQRLVYEVRR